jgi:archaellum biogenesis protein FlaJ (TadC family)
MKRIFPLLHSRVIENFKYGRIAIRVNPGLSLRRYSTISNNVLVKIFRTVVLIYSFPLTIVGATCITLLTGHYLYCLYYHIGLTALIVSESFLSQRITIDHALKSDEGFAELHRAGVIKIITDPEI